MYKVKEIRNEINCISVSDKSFCYNTKKEDLFLNDQRIDTKTSVCGYFLNENYFTYSNNINFTNTIIDLKLNKTTQLGKISLQFQINDKKFVGLEKKEGKRNLIIYELSTGQKITLFKDISFGIKFLYHDSLIINQGWTTLKSLSLHTGEYEWETDLSQFGEIRKVIGVASNYLWVSIYRGGEDKRKKQCVVLDVSTGEHILNIASNLPISDCFVEYISEKQTILSIHSLISSIPADSPLVEFDALTGQVLRNEPITSLLAHNLKIGLWKYQDGKIYFTANTDMITTTHIGVLDYETLDLLWYSEVPNRKGLLKNLQVTEDKMYVLDQSGTLHIFEKEKN